MCQQKLRSELSSYRPLFFVKNINNFSSSPWLPNDPLHHSRLRWCSHANTMVLVHSMSFLKSWDLIGVFGDCNGL